ncbi:MAG: hypothetical protein AB1442_10120 [Nitrospirota bacterium]
MKRTVVLLTIFALLFSANTAFADIDEGFLVVGDLVIARPVGLAVTFIGGAVFVVALPFALTSKSVKSTADTLVGEPLRFTFDRPLGVFRDYGPSRSTGASRKDGKERTVEQER